MSRRSSRFFSGGGGINNNSDSTTTTTNNNNNDTVSSSSTGRTDSTLTREGIERREASRRVAENAASSLARPGSGGLQRLARASKSKSGAISTPSGFIQNTTNNNDNTGWCGPFAIAKEMIAKRDDARAKRLEEEENDKQNHPLDALVVLDEEQRLDEAHPSRKWQGHQQQESNLNFYAKRRKRMNESSSIRIPRLFHLCRDILVDNFEYLEGLGATIDSSIRLALSKELVARNKLDDDSFEKLAEPGVDVLELVDCASVTEDQMMKRLSLMLQAGLSSLRLNHAGRCFGKKVVDTIASAVMDGNSNNNNCPILLRELSIGGAYLLKDEDASRLVASLGKETLQSIEFKACPGIGKLTCQSIASNVVSLKELSFESICLSKDDLLCIASADCMKELRSLSLKSMVLDDGTLAAFLATCGGSLESLALDQCAQLTDQALSCIRENNKNGSLVSLSLSGLKCLTSTGLETFFTPNLPELPPPPSLKALDLSECNFDEVNDDVICLAALVSAMRIGYDYSSNSSFNLEETMKSILHVSEEILSGKEGLVSLNVNATSITDKSLEVLAATSSSSLQELDVGFCHNITNKGLGYLVEKADSQLETVHIWGCAQINEEFLDGHSRTKNVGGLNIVGAWMKK